MLLKSGVIIAGGVFIERLTNYLTTVWGYAFIHSDSDHNHLSKALDILLTKPNPFMKNWTRSMFWVVLVCIEVLVHHFAPIIDQDGIATMDYYVTSAFFLSVLIALLFRNVNMINRTRPIYSHRLWAHGVDVFQARNAGKRIKVDLYEWDHVPAVAKAQLLLDYARTIELHDLEEFDLDEFMDQTEQKGGQEPLVPQEPSSINSVRQRLLAVDKRVAALMHQAPMQADGDDDEGNGKRCAGSKVRCIKKYILFSDVFVLDKGDWKAIRVQIAIEPRASGQEWGRTMHGTVMVEWNNDEYIQHAHHVSEAHQQLLSNSAKILTDIKVTHIVESTSEWHALQDRINAWYEELENEKQLKKAEKKVANGMPI